MTQIHAMTRREVITTSVASLLAWPSLEGPMRDGLAASSRAPTHWPGYAKAIVIDALGGPGGYVPGDDGTAPLTRGMVRDARESGITAVNFTVGSVGNQPDLFAQRDHQKEVAERRRQGISSPGEVEGVYTFVQAYNAPNRLELIAPRSAETRSFRGARREDRRRQLRPVVRRSLEISCK